MPDADETIIIEFLVKAEKAIESTKEFRAQIDTMKEQIKARAKETGESFEVINASIKRVKIKEFTDEIIRLKAEIAKATGMQKAGVVAGLERDLESAKVKMREFKEASTRALREVNQETKGLQGGFQGLISKLGSLGSVGRLVFGSILGLGAVQAIRQLIDVFREALEISLDYQQSLFTLEVAIRGLQRTGLDTTIEGWTSQLAKLKKQFPIFSRKEFVDAASLAALMTREFGFTEDQIADLVKQSAILSEITGKDLNEAVRGVTFAIGSGYFESLQRAGINISRQVVANKALELGYEGVYNELEPVIRASITYAVIQDNLNAIQEDAGRIVDTTAGQTRRLKAAWEDLLVVLGTTVTGTDEAKDAISELASSIEALRELIALLGTDQDNLGTSLAKNILLFGPATGVIKTFTNYVGGQVPLVIDKVIAKFDGWGWSIDNVTRSLIAIQKLLGIFEEPILGDLEQEVESISAPRIVGGVEFSEEEYKAIIDATQELTDEISEIDEEAAEKNLEIWDKWFKDREEIIKKHSDRMADLESDLANRITEIDLKEQQKIDDEIAKNAFSIEDALRKAAFRREDAERKYRERELKEERKFQEKLRQLRENFLLNLEDAVRERDARQIIRLTRQFNLRRTQMIREEKLGKTDREDAFKEELRQIERQKQERLRQLAIEHQRRLDAIARQSQRERDQANLDNERKKTAEALRFEEEKTKREERRDEQLADLKDATQERIDAVLESLQKEYDLSEPQLDAISELWENAYGPDGRIDAAIQNTLNRIAQLIAWMNVLRTSMGTVPDPIRREKESFQDFSDDIRREKEFNFAGGQAEGGTIIARKPTVAIFGEAGPEMAQFTPLNQLGARGTFGGQSISGRQSSTNKLRLEMLLSPDLEARIIDQALDEVADVTFTIERERA